MWVPKMTDEERHGFVHGGAWIGKLATYGPDGTIRMTPLHYAEQDGVIWFDTWDSSAAAANIRRDGRASVLIDSPTQPYRGVHLVGEAEVRAVTASPEEYADRFAAYVDDREAALEMIVMLRTIAPLWRSPSVRARRSRGTWASYERHRGIPRTLWPGHIVAADSTTPEERVISRCAGRAP